MRRVLGMVSVMLILAGHAHAQSSDSGSIAEQLFNQARDLAKAKRWAEACSKFEASLRYDPALGTRLNLATCYEHLGKLASAWSVYRESIDLARKLGDTKRRDYARNQAAALEPRLARLAIAAPARPPAGFVVTRDGTQIDPGALGIALYVDAGAHEVTASAPGFEAFSRTVTLADGKTETLVIPDLAAKPVHGPMIEPTEPAAPPSRTRRYAAIGLSAAGAAVVVVGLAFGAKANSTYGDAKVLCGASLSCTNPIDYSKDKQLVHDARSSAAVATVLTISGSAVIVAGAVLVLTAPRTHERAAARVVPVAGDRGAGLAIAGTF